MHSLFFFWLLSAYVIGKLSANSYNVAYERRLDTNTLSSMEMQVLQDLYSATDGPNWLCCEAGFVRWNFTNTSSNPCTDNWQGLRCQNSSSQAFISQLSLGNNILIGTIPSSLGSLSSVGYVSLQNNSLYGTIPSGLGNLTSVDFLYLASNNLTGTIPSAFGNLSRAAELALQQNRLSGTIPTALGKLTTLQLLMLSQNELTGPIPSNIFHMRKIAYIYMSQNHLTGTIPTTLGKLTEAVVLQLSLNRITGTIPPELLRITPPLAELYLDGNLLSGSMPSAMGAIFRLQYLDVGDNSLTGLIPTSLVLCTDLISISLDNNVLSGTLENVFNSTTQLSLNTIEFNNNQLTGVLPDVLFTLVKIRTLVGSVNCFHGTLPTTVCQGNTLASLVLDGLATASSCRIVPIPLMSSAFISGNAVEGTLPACMFNLKNLSTLYLSGNNFYGSLPSDLAVDPLLVSLDLSHNQLTGGIGDSLQFKQWLTLDMSYNRFGGSLNADFESDVGKLYLQNNRLSGIIPGSIVDMQTVDVLAGNIFSCRFDGLGLPQNDENTDTYSCSSSNFEYQYFLWMALVVVCMIGVVVVIMRYEGLLKNIDGKIVEWLKHTDPSSVDTGSISELGKFFNCFLLVTGYSTMFIVLVLAPMYLTLSYYYGIYLHQYAYVMSAAFLGGVVPFALEFVLWIFLLAAVLFYLYQFVSVRNPKDNPLVKNGTLFVTKSGRTRHVSDVTNSVTAWQLFFIRFIFMSLNIIVVVAVNAAYVIMAIYGDRYLLFCEQIFLSFFKFTWNYIYCAKLLHKVAKWFVDDPEVVKSHDFNVRFQPLIIRSTLLNNILIPLLVVMYISPNCFYSFFYPPPPITVAYSTEKCQIATSIINTCISEVTVPQEYEYTPPFTYGYQCSSSFITYYAPAFVSLCVLNTFVVPLTQYFAIKYLTTAVPGTWSYRLINICLSSRIHRMTALMRSAIVEEREGDEGNRRSSASRSSNRGSMSSIGNTDVAAVVSTAVQQETILCIVELANTGGLLLTYGVMFPPLALCLALTIFCVVYTTKIFLGRFLTISKNYKKFNCTAIVEKECSRLNYASFVRSLVWMWLVLGCCFYTMFLFDVYGDAVGFDKAYWVLIVVPLIPFFLYGLLKAYQYVMSTVEVDNSLKHSVELLTPTLSPILQNLQKEHSNLVGAQEVNRI